MKKLTFLLLTLASVTFTSKNSLAACYSVANGNWNTASTWLCNGVPSIPGCGDVIYVNHTVTVNSQIGYEDCPTPIHIVISGTLAFTNGNKLELPCNSSVTILPGGTVTKTTAGGGSSTLISICNTNVWTASAGTQTGPLVWGTPPAGLPVELVSFQGKMTDHGVFLTWEVAAEINNEYFMVERRSAEGEFVEMGRVEGRINANTLYLYTYTDEYPEQGDNYYRLAQVDLDGTRTFSDIIHISYSSNGVFLSEPYPNPVEDVLSVNVASVEDVDITVEIIDLAGKMILSHPYAMQAGDHTIRMQASHLQQGTYMVRVLQNGAHAEPGRLFIKN